MLHRRRAIVRIKVVVGLFYVGLLIVFPVIILGAYKTIEWSHYANDLRAKGHPLTFAEIESRRLPIPDDRNSAIIIEGFWDELEGLENPLDDLKGLYVETGDSIFDGFHQSTVDASRDFLSSHRGLLIQLRTIRDMRQGRYRIAYDREPFEIIFSFGGEAIRSAARLIYLDQQVRLINKDVTGSLKDIVLLFRLAGSLHSEPSTISALTQLAVEAKAVEGVESLLRADTLSEKQLVLLSAELRALDKKDRLRWALLGERAVFIQMCDALMSGRVPLRPIACEDPDLDECQELAPPWGRLPALVGRPNQLRGARMLTSLLEKCEDPRELIRAAQEFDSEVRNMPASYFLARLLLPSLSAAAELNCRISAYLRCTIAGVAAERFRLDKGRLPETLDELVPSYLTAIIVDPFVNKPLLLKKTEHGIVIYSVAKDLVDNGGIVEVSNQAQGERAPDIGFRLNDVAHRGVLLVDDPPVEED